MSKYIDVDKLIAEIEKLNSLVPYESKDRHDEGLHDAYKAVKNIITSLQQEPSLPSNLDEAAKKIVIQLHPSMEYSAVLGDRLTTGELIELVKAGAEWMAEQGETVFDTIVIDGQGQRWLTDNLLLGDYDNGEEVIVQIRKKNNEV